MFCCHSNRFLEGNLQNMTPNLQGYAGQCTLGSLAQRLLGQYSLGSPALPPPPTRSYTGSDLLTHLYRPFPSPLYWFPMRHTLPPFLFLYSWVFSTGDSACSYLLKLVPSSRIFLPLRWRRYIPPKLQFTQDLHGATYQKVAFFIVTAVKTSNLTQYCSVFCATVWTPKQLWHF
jgi:hypothetical protein